MNIEENIMRRIKINGGSIENKMIDIDLSERVNPLKLYLGKVRLERLNCSKCNRHIIKGSNCLFTRWTWTKYCLECGKEMIKRKIIDRKEEIKNYKRLAKRMDNFKLVKENMCASLRS